MNIKNASLRAQEWIMTIVAWLVIIYCAVILFVKVPEVYGPFSRIQAVLFCGAVVCFGLALCLVAAHVFLGFKTFTIDWEKLRPSPKIRMFLGIILGVVICGLMAQIAYHTWLVLWYLGYAFSLIGGGAIVWNAKFIKTTSGEDELPDSTLFGGLVCWMLSMCAMNLIVNDRGDFVGYSLVFIVWPVAMLLVWLARRYSGWKKSPAT